MKQRLIGAAVLVALAVIFLPMLIGGPEPESGKDGREVSMDMPTREDRRFETRDLALPTPASTPPAPDIPSIEPNLTPPSSSEGAQGLATVDMTDASPRRDALTDAPVGTEVAPAPAPRTPPANRTPATPVTAPPPASSSTAVAATSANGNWAVHLGVYANAANADALVNQLKGRGIPAYSESVTMENGKTARRVRVGPFAQRSEAESARLTVRAARSDVPSSVVSIGSERPATSAPATAVRSTASNNAPTPAPTPTARPASGSGFAVQIGALRSQADANALRERASAAGFAAFVEQAATASGTLWRVRVGPEAQRAGADALKADIKRKLGIDGNVVTHP